MKKTILFTAVAAFSFVSVAAFSQERKTDGAPQTTPMVAPSMKTKNTQNSQNSSSHKSNSGTTGENKNDQKKKTDSPPVQNKIAVSDAGVPANKSNAKTSNSSHQPESKKTPNSAPVSPK